MFNTTECHVWLYRYPWPTKYRPWDTQQENRVIINHLLLIFKFNVYESRDLKNPIFFRLKSDIIKIRQIEENLCRNDIQKQRKYFKKRGKTSQSILSLNNVFDLLKKKVLFTLNVFKVPFGWVVFFSSIFFVIYLFFYFYIGNKELIVFYVCIIVL